jgi:hypothetical protein
MPTQLGGHKIFLSHTMKNMKKCLIWVVFSPPLPGKWPDPDHFSMGDETSTPAQRCIPNMKTTPSKLWSVASRNQSVSGGGRDQNQSIPDFVRGYNYYINVIESLQCHIIYMHKHTGYPYRHTGYPDSSTPGTHIMKVPIIHWMPASSDHGRGSVIYSLVLLHPQGSWSMDA